MLCVAQKMIYEFSTTYLSLFNLHLKPTLSRNILEKHLVLYIRWMVSLLVFRYLTHYSCEILIVTETHVQIFDI
jgi:hypothetical protein